MEFFGLLVIAIAVWLLVTLSNSGNAKKLPPRTRAANQTKRRPAPRKKTPQNDETPWARQSRASAGKRVTNGIEHDPPPDVPSSRKLVGRAWVIDGDTIRIGQIKIRLAGIDAPELDEPWGRKSKWAMVNICKGKTIHVDLTGETSYDRLVGTCYLPCGTDIGAELVKEVLALDGSYYSKGKYLHLEPEGARKRLSRYGLKQRWK